MKIKYLILVILLSLIIVFGILVSGSVLWFIDPPSFVVIFFPPLFLSLILFGPKEIAKAYRMFFQGDSNIGSLKKASNYFATMQNYVWLSAFLGACMGLIGMFGTVTTPEGIARGLATIIITIFYAVLAQMIFIFPFYVGIKKKIVALESGES